MTRRAKEHVEKPAPTPSLKAMIADPHAYFASSQDVERAALSAEAKKRILQAWRRSSPT